MNQDTMQASYYVEDSIEMIFDQIKTGNFCNDGKSSFRWMPACRHGNLTDTCKERIQTSISHVGNNFREWMHMGEFQNAFSGTIFGLWITQANGTGGQISDHKQCKSKENGGRINELWVIKDRKACCIYIFDNNNCKPNNKIQAERGPNLGPTVGFVQS